MISRRNWALVIHASPTLGLMVQGLLYVTTSEFMPYHSDAVGAAWGDLPPNYQGFFLGVLRGMGAGSIGVTLAIAFILLIPFRRGDRWALWAVPAIGVVFTALTAYAAFTIDVRTPALRLGGRLWVLQRCTLPAG